MRIRTGLRFMGPRKEQGRARPPTLHQASRSQSPGTDLSPCERSQAAAQSPAATVSGFGFRAQSTRWDAEWMLSGYYLWRGNGKCFLGCLTAARVMK